MWLCVLALITLVTSSRLQTTLSELSSNSSVCVLPPYPQYGIYEVANVPSARPGQSYSTAMLTVKCRRGFGLADQPGSTDLVFCVNGLWLQSMPRCVRFCRLDPDPSVRYMCYVTGRGVQVCEKYVPPGTIVSPVCNTPNYYSNEMLLPMTCVFGYWNYIARCKAECGRITPSGIDLVIDGTAAKRGELPWHVGIYRKTNQSFEQICGGSLVSENVVISAAHCFWSESRMILTSKYAVGIGKLHRPWDSEEDADAQKSEVKEIRIPALYQGAAANFQEDLSVIILTTPFNYTTYIRPVCLNFGTIFDSLQLQHGKLGKVAGWGFTTVNGIPSQTLNVVEMPFISVDVCLNALPQSFIGYVTSDKFCAGYTNGTVLCKGDSGGGLVFLDKELGVDRFYLRGIASTAPNEGNKLCNDNTYITFTKISKHQDFIKGVLAASAQKLCPMYSFQCNDGSCVDPGSDCNGRRDCADGSDESEEYCLVTTTSATVQVLSTTQQYVSNLDIGPVLTTQSSKLVSTETDSSTQASTGIIDDSNNQNSPWLAALYHIHALRRLIHYGYSFDG